jgi:hypothetical protein
MQRIALEEYYTARALKGGNITVFVAMPFVQTSNPQRKESQLTGFFKLQLKQPIEAINSIPGVTFQVIRSDKTFNINENLIHQLYRITNGYLATRQADHLDAAGDSTELAEVKPAG